MRNYEPSKIKPFYSRIKWQKSTIGIKLDQSRNIELKIFVFIRKSYRILH